MTQPHAVTPFGDAVRSKRRLVAGFVLLLLAAWCVAVAVSAGLAYLDVSAARTSFDVAERQLRDNDVRGARGSLTDAAERADTASSRLEQPHLRPVARVPVVSDNLLAVGVLSRAARDVGTASAEVLDALLTVLEDDGSAGLGRASLVGSEAFTPVLWQLATTLRKASDDVHATGPAWLLEPIERARARFLEVTESTVDGVELAAELSEIVPGLLGASEPQAYLVGAAALSELRASGGLLGSWSLLTADRGELSFDDFSAISILDGAGVTADAPSEDFAARYERFGGLREWRSTNLTPDFPTAAQVMLDLWEAQGGAPLAGVIVTDTVTFQRIVERSGPVEVPGLVTLTAENTLDFVGVEAYAAFEDQAERKEVLGGVAASALQRVLEVVDSNDVRATASMFGDLARGGHLRVFARDANAQAVLQRAGVAGELSTVEGEFAGVYVNNFGANKVDFFTDRQVEHRVALQPDGRTRATIEVSFANDAPREGYPRYVLGPWTSITEAGDNLAFISVFCGYECEFERIPTGAVDGGFELDRPVVDINLLIPSKSERRLRYRTSTADGWWVDDDQIVVRVHHFAQPTVRGTDLRIVVPLPDGWEPNELPENAVITDDQIVWHDPSASGPTELDVRLVPTGTASDDGQP